MPTRSSRMQKLLDLIGSGFFVEEGNERPAINYLRRHRYQSRCRSSFRDSVSAFIRSRCLYLPRRLRICLPVIGFSKMPLDVVWTTAWVPSSISNSLRILRGMTIWPFRVKDTVSLFVEFFIWPVVCQKAICMSNTFYPTNQVCLTT